MNCCVLWVCVTLNWIWILWGRWSRSDQDSKHWHRCWTSIYGSAQVEEVMRYCGRCSRCTDLFIQTQQNIRHQWRHRWFTVSICTVALLSTLRACCTCAAVRPPVRDQRSWSYHGFYFIPNQRPQHLHDPHTHWPAVNTLRHVAFILKEVTPSVRFDDGSLDGGRPTSDVMSVKHGNTWSSSSMTSWVDVWKQWGSMASFNI